MNFNFAGLATKRIAKVDVKVLAGSRFKIGTEAMDLLGLKGDDTSRIFLDKDITTNKFFIAGIPVVKDDSGKVTSPGMRINKDGIFSQGTINLAIGGQHTELEIEKDQGIDNGGITFYPLKETVNGEAKRAELAAKTDAALDNQVNMFQEEQESPRHEDDVEQESIDNDNIEASTEEEHLGQSPVEDTVETVDPIGDAEARAQQLADFDAE
jgi:hypothetical protein